MIRAIQTNRTSHYGHACDSIRRIEWEHTIPITITTVDTVVNDTAAPHHGGTSNLTPST